MNTILVLLIILLILMALIGGKHGVSSYFSIIFNFLLIVLAALLISWGMNIVLTGIIFIPLKLLTIVYLGTEEKNIARISYFASLIVTVLITFLITLLEMFAESGGFGLQHSEALGGLATSIGVNYVQLGILIGIFSVLGAVAEASVAMSSGLIEFIEQTPVVTADKINKSGYQIGFDVLGSTVNTILFGLFGGSLPLFVWYFKLKYNFLTIINDKMFAGEFLIVVYSIVAVLLIIPLTIKLITIFFRRGYLNADYQKDTN